MICVVSIFSGTGNAISNARLNLQNKRKSCLYSAQDKYAASFNFVTLTEAESVDAKKKAKTSTDATFMVAAVTTRLQSLEELKPEFDTFTDFHVAFIVPVPVRL